MGVGMIKNAPAVIAGVDLMFRRAQEQTREEFQNFVWEIFKRILRESPQWSGKGVANWNLSVNAPNLEYREDFGDEIGALGRHHSVGALGATHQRGDERWARIARDRARPIKNGIFLKDKVFISNATRGDGDEVGAELYMQALQNPGYWTYKLREVNKPYEIAQESVIIVTMQQLKRGFLPAKVSGQSWGADE